MAKVMVLLFSLFIIIFVLIASLILVFLTIPILIAFKVLIITENFICNFKYICISLTFRSFYFFKLLNKSFRGIVKLLFQKLQNNLDFLTTPVSLLFAKQPE